VYEKGVVSNTILLLGICLVLNAFTLKINRWKGQLTVPKHEFVPCNSVYNLQNKNQIFLYASPNIARHQEGAYISIITCQNYFVSHRKAAHFN
jgi:hypothetical protein